MLLLRDAKIKRNQELIIRNTYLNSNLENEADDEDEAPIQLKKRDPKDITIKWAQKINNIITSQDLISKAKDKQEILKITSHHYQGSSISNNIPNQTLQGEASNASKRDSHGSTIQLSSFYNDINLILILKTSQIYQHQKDKDTTKLEALNIVHQTTKNQIFESRRSSRNQSKVDINSPKPTKDKSEKVQISNAKNQTNGKATIENSI